MKNSLAPFSISEVEIHYKRPGIADRPKITSAQSAIEVFRTVFPTEKIDLKEFFYVLLLSRSNHVLGVAQIGVGSTVGTVVNVKEIFQLVLKANASGIILAHNHPSGNLKPSHSDRKITQKIANLATMLECQLLDHIILTSEDYFSFADNGEL